MSRPRGGSLDPPVGGNYIQTSNKWLEHEVAEMKKIHSAYLRSLDVEEIQRLQDSGSKSDTEFFLPKDCSLRSDRGELLKPLWGGRGPFESNDEFVASTQFSYWIQETQGGLNIDDMMNDWAKTIIRDVCADQADKNLRDKSSQGLMGSGTKREHLSPLALVLHDLKQWCVLVLRNGKTTDRDTYMEVGRRIKFLIYLMPKDVWHVRSKLNPFNKGLPRAVHQTLVACIQRSIGVLNEVQEYCFRRYLQHLVHEKIALLLHLMQTEVFNVARLCSAICTFEEIVETNRERQLRQTELVEPSVTQAHSDWTVLVNVLLRFTFRDKFARASLTNDLSQFDSEKEGANMMKTWTQSNPFISRPGQQPKQQQPAPVVAHDANGKPLTPQLELGDVLDDHKMPGMPACYQTCVESLNKELAEGSSMFGSAVGKHVRYPLTKDKQFASTKKTFPNDGDRAKALKALIRAVASLWDTIPSFFVLNNFLNVTRGDQRIAIDSVLRTELIRAIGDMGVRFCYVLTTAKCVVEEFAELAGAALAALGKMDEAAQLLLNGPGVRREASTKVAVTNRKGSVVGTKKGASANHTPVVGDPIWVINLDLACSELYPAVTEGARAVFKTANELAAELYYFNPGQVRQIETAEERACVTYCDCLLRTRPDDFSGTSFLLARIAPKKDFLNLPSKRLAETFRFATEECAYQIETDSMAYSTKLALLDQELQQALKPSAHDDDDDLDDLDLNSHVSGESSAAKRVASSISSAMTKSSAKDLKAASKKESAPTTTLAVKSHFEDEDGGSFSADKKQAKKRGSLSLFGKKLF